MYCRNCGNKLDGNERYCSKCKNIVNAKESDEVAKNSNKKVIKVKFKNFFIGIIVLFLLLLSIFIVLIKKTNDVIYSNDNVKNYLDTSNNLSDITEDSHITMSFSAGKSVKDYAKIIESNTNNTEDDVYYLLTNEQYIDTLIQKYWFLTEEIKNENIYFPLEGYLRPNTYTFESKNISVQRIIESILDDTNEFILKYKAQLESNKYTVHQILSLASIVELESSNIEDMPMVAGVFFNRLNNDMNLDSDVTTYYAFKVDFSENLSTEQINTYNAYNTRGPNMKGKLPIGPICSPSIEAIESVLKYEPNDYYYFVADINGKMHYAEDNKELVDVIEQLKRQNLWYEDNTASNSNIYAQIYNGMTYYEVTKILRSPKSTTGNVLTDMFATCVWNTDEGVIIIQFMNGKVYQKSLH